MTAEAMWAAFCEQRGYLDCRYDAWAFGMEPDALADLVCMGKKRATASAYDLCALSGESLPQAGEYSVVLGADGNARCIVRTTHVQVLPFCEVTQEMAALEGEGDRSLSYWRAVHRAFFTEELAQVGLSFDERIPVVFERFELMYTPHGEENR